MVLSCIDSVEEILSDWCDTGAGTKKSDKVVLPPKLPKMHIFGNFEGNKNGTFGARKGNLKTLFNTNKSGL